MSPETRILPEYEHIGGTEDLRSAILQGLGAASVSWEPMDGTGVFESERCVQIADELLDVAYRWANGRDSDRAEMKEPTPAHRLRWHERIYVPSIETLARRAIFLAGLCGAIEADLWLSAHL